MKLIAVIFKQKISWVFVCFFLSVCSSAHSSLHCRVLSNSNVSCIGRCGKSILNWSGEFFFNVTVCWFVVLFFISDVHVCNGQHELTWNFNLLNSSSKARLSEKFVNIMTLEITCWRVSMKQSPPTNDVSVSVTLAHAGLPSLCNREAL